MMLAILLAAAVAAGAAEPGLAPLDASDATMSLHNKAVAHWGLGMYETAAREFEEVLTESPASAGVRANLGMLLLVQKRYAQALPELEKAAAAAPDSPRAQSLLGRCLSALGRHDEALARLRRAEALDPREPSHHARLADALLGAGRAAQAEAELRRLLEMRPDDGPALYRLARLARNAGREAESAALLGRFAALGRGAGRAAPGAYDAPWENPPAESEGRGGPRWLEVRAVASHGGACFVTVQAGRLSLRRRAEAAPVRFWLGSRAKADAVRVDWPDGGHSYSVDAPADRVLTVEEFTAHVW